MIRLVLLALQLVAVYAGQAGGGWDPNGLDAEPPATTSAGDIVGGLDPNG
jgi:hypothetical protein